MKFEKGILVDRLSAEIHREMVETGGINTLIMHPRKKHLLECQDQYVYFGNKLSKSIRKGSITTFMGLEVRVDPNLPEDTILMGNLKLINIGKDNV